MTTMPREQAKSTVIAVDLAAPGGDMSAVWDFARGTSVLVHPRSIGEQLPAMQPYMAEVLRRLEQPVLTPIKTRVLPTPDWPISDPPSEVHEARRTAAWAEMRAWIEGQVQTSDGFQATLQAQQDAIRSGMGITRTIMDQQGRPSSRAVEIGMMFHDDVQGNTESAASNAGADQHQNQE